MGQTAARRYPDGFCPVLRRHSPMDPHNPTCSYLFLRLHQRRGGFTEGTKVCQCLHTDPMSVKPPQGLVAVKLQASKQHALRQLRRQVAVQNGLSPHSLEGSASSELQSAPSRSSTGARFCSTIRKQASASAIQRYHLPTPLLLVVEFRSSARAQGPAFINHNSYGRWPQ